MPRVCKDEQNKKEEILTVDHLERGKLTSEFFKCANEELRKKNRFTNQSLDKVVEALLSENSNIKEISEGILKRARIYDKADKFSRYRNPPKSRFQGFNAKDSFVNEKGNEGRCNPKFIPYLYAADSVPCSIAEINPGIDSVVSVANIKIQEKLKVVSLCSGFAISDTTGNIIKDIPDCWAVLYLQHLFSLPYQEDGDYLLTQYISEKIKCTGMDGLLFNSSKYAYVDEYGMRKQGVNYVIFNYDKCKAVSSKLYRVKSIDMVIE